MVDLDDTLIDTSKYKNILFTALSKETNISYGKIKEEYKKIKRETKLKDGWTEKFINNLGFSKGEGVGQLIELTYRKTGEVRADNKVLNYVTKFKGKKIIFTYGDRGLQNAKIERLKLRKHFDDVIIISEEEYSSDT